MNFAKYRRWYANTMNKRPLHMNIQQNGLCCMSVLHVGYLSILFSCSILLFLDAAWGRHFRFVCACQLQCLLFSIKYVLYMHNMNFICHGLDMFVAKIWKSQILTWTVTWISPLWSVATTYFCKEKKEKTAFEITDMYRQTRKCM